MTVKEFELTVLKLKLLLEHNMISKEDFKATKEKLLKDMVKENESN